MVVLVIAVLTTACDDVSQAAVDEVSAMSPERIAELTDIWCSGVARNAADNPDYSTEQHIATWVAVLGTIGGPSDEDRYRMQVVGLLMLDMDCPTDHYAEGTSDLVHEVGAGLIEAG